VFCTIFRENIVLLAQTHRKFNGKLGAHMLFPFLPTFLARPAMRQGTGARGHSTISEEGMSNGFGQSFVPWREEIEGHNPATPPHKRSYQRSVGTY
jgi:hypothetical protein